MRLLIRLQCILMLWLALSACQPLVPARTPPQLQQTPGAFVSLTADTYDAGVFRVRYPEGWRVVKTNIAAAPMSVVFVSPDETLTIQLSEAPLDPPDTDASRTFTRSVQQPLNGMTLYAYAEAPLSRRDDLQQLLQRVLESARPGHP